MKYANIPELLRTVDRSHPEVKALAEALEAYRRVVWDYVNGQAPKAARDSSDAARRVA